VDDARLSLGSDMPTIARGRKDLEYADLLQFPEGDGNRYEILDGRLYVTPSPNVTHQRVLGRLFKILDDYFEPRGLGEVFFAPLDVILTNRDVVEPDIFVVDNADHLTERAVEGPPLLAIEILSPSTAKRDRGIKATRYALLGVPHYWLVDPKARTLTCYKARDGEYEPVATVAADGTLAHRDFPGLIIKMSEIWAASPVKWRRRR